MKLFAAVVLFLTVLTPPVRSQGVHFDILIRGGKVYDGSGNPWRAVNIGIRGARIAAVGSLTGATAHQTIDAAGKVVTPGFVDLHSHADGPIYGPRGLRSPDQRRRAAPNLVAQGITTVVVNQDGRSVWPIAEQLSALERLKIGPNAILLIGHGTVRRRVMEDDFRRPATDEEIAQMRAMVRQGMDEGAYGLSAGLEYAPGRWSTTDEVVALTEEIVPYGGIYVSHQRSEGADPMWYWPSEHEARPPSLLDAVRETVEIGERTGATVVATHIKAKGANYWGTSRTAVRLINDARARGVSVYADQYPYNTTGSDGNTVLIPGWVFQGQSRSAQQGRQDRDYAAALRTALRDDARAARIRADIRHEIARRGGPENVVVMEHPDASLVGKTIGAIAAAHNHSPVDVAIALQLDGSPRRRGGARVRGFSLSDYDIEPYAVEPWTATATDGWINLPEDGPTHTRVYGTFPRKIREYAIERSIMTVSDAVRSSTSLPAQILGLNDRGVIKAGYVADVVVMDLTELADNSTFFEPHQYPSGIEHVLIGGEPAVQNGQLTWALPGRVISPPRPIEALTTGGSR